MRCPPGSRKTIKHNYMSTYSLAPKSVADIALVVMQRYPRHKALLEARVPCRAIVKKISTKERTFGQPDARILIDANWWNAATEKQRIALLDHELYHLIVVEEEPGVYAVDDLGRPKISMRPHDFQVGWFAIIAREHGEDAGEVEQSKQVFDDYGQCFWPEIWGHLNAHVPLANRNVPDLDEASEVAALVLFLSSRSAISRCGLSRSPWGRIASRPRSSGKRPRSLPPRRRRGRHAININWRRIIAGWSPPEFDTNCTNFHELIYEI